MSRTPALSSAGLVVLLAALCVAVSAQGQDPPPQVQTQPPSTHREIPAFRSRVTLVPLDVRAIDRDGNPVTDLTKGDFIILEGSVPQPIAHFDAHGLVAESAAPRARPVLRQAPGDVLTPARGRTFLLVLGRGLIQEPFDGVGSLIQFVRERLLPQDLVAVMAYNRATDFTTEHERVIAILERYRDRNRRIETLLEHYYSGPDPEFQKCKACLPEFILPKINDIFLSPGAIVSRQMPEAIGEGEDIFGGRERRFYDALVETELARTRVSNTLTSGAAMGLAELTGEESSADYIAGRYVATQDSDKLLNGISLMRYLDGEKHLVFFAEKGLSLTSADEDVIILRAAADARIVIHAVLTGGIPAISARGLVTSPNRKGATPAARLNLIPGWLNLFAGLSMKRLAEGTGGIASVYSYPREAVARIDEVTRFEYLLGYYPANSASDGRYRKVEVKVNRPGVTVLVRSGYYANDVIVPRGDAAFTTYRRMADVGTYRDSVRDLALTLKVSQAKTADKKSQSDVMVDLKIDPSRIGFDRSSGRYVATLEVRVSCGDSREKVVGEVASTVRLNLTEDTYRRYLRSGIPYTARVAVTSAPRWAKVVVYDAASDLAGSTVTRLK